MLHPKVAAHIVDRNGKMTTVWRNADNDTTERSQSLTTPPAAAMDAVVPIPSTVTVHNSQGQEVTLSTDDFGWDAKEVYAEGQCIALAVALSEELGGLPIKVAMNMSGNILIHAWVDDDGVMYDANNYGELEDDFIEEMYMQWGTPEITEYDAASLRSWVDSENPSAPQNWEAAEYMIPALMKDYNSH
jgi:hypothetical protein